MKIRYGYVSNSSSSSFLLVFDKKLKDVEELMGMLNFEDIQVADEVYWKWLYFDKS
jgi:hypothetical protein